MEEKGRLTGNRGNRHIDGRQSDTDPSYRKVSDRKELGAESEEIAAGYLIDQGYAIVRRNYRTAFGEIDLICERKGLIVFVEVRSKRSLRFGTGAESVILRKQRKIRRVAEQYLLQEKWVNRRIRFDVIEIYYEREKDEKKPKLRHLEGAF